MTVTIPDLKKEKSPDPEPAKKKLEPAKTQSDFFEFSRPPREPPVLHYLAGDFVVFDKADARYGHYQASK